ncbi:8271_t:CDS:2, partial [Entrophospora sp. SA101]
MDWELYLMFGLVYQYRLIGRQSWEGAPEALRKINERKSKKSKSSKSLIFALIVI